MCEMRIYASDTELILQKPENEVLYKDIIRIGSFIYIILYPGNLGQTYMIC